MTIRTWIDEPGLFDPVEAWEEYLETMKKVPENDPLRDLAIEDAQVVIERKRREILGSV